MFIDKNNTLIILDWDDTLFPTTWVMQNNIDLKNNINTLEHLDYFTFLDNNLFNLLTKMLLYGDVVIITNAMMNWINISSSVLSKTRRILELNGNSGHIRIVSARNDYQNINSDPFFWKNIAFKNELKNVFKKKYITNIISIGDAEYEFKALQDLHDYHEHFELLKHKKHKNTHYFKFLKSIRFIRYPSRDILLDQLKVLHKSMHDVCTSKSHLDLLFKSISNNNPN